MAGQIELIKPIGALIKYFPRNLMEQSQFDGILFHERNINTRDLPTKDQRRPDQIYIHFNMESPVWSNLDIAGKLID